MKDCNCFLTSRRRIENLLEYYDYDFYPVPLLCSSPDLSLSLFLFSLFIFIFWLLCCPPLLSDPERVRNKKHPEEEESREIYCEVHFLSFRFHFERPTEVKK